MRQANPFLFATTLLVGLMMLAPLGAAQTPPAPVPTPPQKPGSVPPPPLAAVPGKPNDPLAIGPGDQALPSPMVPVAKPGSVP